MLNIPGPPGHRRYTTGKHRAVLYSVVIFLCVIAFILLNKLWKHLNQEYDVEKSVLEMGENW